MTQLFALNTESPSTFWPKGFCAKNGSPAWARTRDTVVNSHLLSMLLLSAEAEGLVISANLSHFNSDYVGSSDYRLTFVRRPSVA